MGSIPTVYLHLPNRFISVVFMHKHTVLCFVEVTTFYRRVSICTDKVLSDPQWAIIRPATLELAFWKTKRGPTLEIRGVLLLF